VSDCEEFVGFLEGD